MIEEKKVTTYTAVCDTCGKIMGRRYRKTLAEADLHNHRHLCGKHYQQYDNTGGYRGILGGWNVYCACGEHWVTDNPSEPFKCPKDPN